MMDLDTDSRIREFLARTGMSSAGLSRLALGNARLPRMLDGRDTLTLYSRARLDRWMRDNPDGVPPRRRPSR